MQYVVSRIGTRFEILHMLSSVDLEVRKYGRRRSSVILHKLVRCRYRFMEKVLVYRGFFLVDDVRHWSSRALYSRWIGFQRNVICGHRETQWCDWACVRIGSDVTQRTAEWCWRTYESTTDIFQSSGYREKICVVWGIKPSSRCAFEICLMKLKITKVGSW